MCQEYEGRIGNLEYKTIRYRGHGRIFAAMREIGLFATDPGSFGEVAVAPRTVLQDLLTENLPQGGPDLSLVEVSVNAGGATQPSEYPTNTTARSHRWPALQPSRRPRSAI